MKNLGTVKTSVVADTSESVLVAASATKTYGPVRALVDMSLSVKSGEIHALVGENGSGKSTFVGIVSGTVVPDSGTIAVADIRFRNHNPVESQKAGALTVFQDGSLVPELTVAQNIYAGTPSAQRPKYKDVLPWARARLREYDLEFDADKNVSTLPPGDRQLLEIVRAVMARPRLLLLDEATSALDASGVTRVLDLMRAAASSGSAVLFVTHRLSEVFRVADNVSVLRDGAFVGTYPAALSSPGELVELMAGSSVEMEFPLREVVGSNLDVVMSVKGLVGSKYGPIDLVLHPGQILGIAGADGNGQAQLIRGLVGLDTTDGEIHVGGVKIKNYREATANGMVFLSGDRKNESLFQSLEIRDNLSLGVLSRFSTAGVVRPVAEKNFVSDQIIKFGIRLGSPAQLPGELSGGNQQKIAISRALSTGPKVIVVDEPTQGVDVRSRLDIYRMLRESANAGNSVVIVSSDASELAGIADRIIVMSRGSVIEEFDGLTANEEKIVGAFAVETRSGEQEAGSVQGRKEVGVKRVSSAGWMRNPEFIRLAGLALFVVLIGLFTASQNATFLSQASLYNVFLIATPLAAVAMAQYCVLLVGGIDVSVGATMSLSVVVMSFLIQEGGLFQSIVTSIFVSIALGLIVGFVNAWLVEKMKLSAVIATIATLGIVGGLALALRPTPGGNINYEFMMALTQPLGVIPIPLVVLVTLVIVGDLLLRRTGSGMRIRAVGLNSVYATRLGIRARSIRMVAYLLSGVMAAVAGVFLAGQVGVGDASVGDIYTLLAIAAPVLGGASLAGGRGTLTGVIFGSILLSLSLTLSVVLKISQGLNLVVIGTVTLIALLTYVVKFNRKSRA